MCVSALAIGMSAQWPLLIAGNRDEFLERPTLALHEWSTPAGVSVWGGRDELDGGGWMLLASDGSAAALVTNVRDAQLRRGERSRGQLPVQWIDAVAQGRSDAFWTQLEGSLYGGFNLICGLPTQGRWWYFSNRDGHPPRPLSTGLYGVSNASLDTPWTKTLKLKQHAATSLDRPDFNSLCALLQPELADITPAPAHELPDTGVGIQTEHILSSVFIDWPQRAYGTRSSHVVALDAQARPRFWEATYPAQFMQPRNQPQRVQSLG